ncbi:pancreatic lipase-related protein 2-like [Centruroides vittatus]|uniref:pancreatic lipase-related protein 2-like n=1 Tax=Centruroides vittatus TaxID=120091 RepID=UPI00350EF98F
MPCSNVAYVVGFSIGKRVRCLKNLGCFGVGPPFAQPKRRPISYIPNSREFIGTKFLLYTHRDPWFNELLIPDQIETIERSKFNSELPTKVIVHGFLDSILLTTWMKRLTRQLFSVGDYNVIIVDWFIGSTFASYGKAVANARVVGAEIAFLMERLQLVKGAKLKDFHLICHSLGAHVCGYAGKRLSNLGRITGLDPAGPYFRNVSSKVRLDASDATFVDIIHTNAAESILKGLGTNEVIGDFDFFPNGGQNNPGCKTLREKKKSRTFLEFIRPQKECDHRRSIEFFIASISYPECFVAVSCRSYLDLTAGKCNCSDVTPCAFMGFHANQFEHLIRNTRDEEAEPNGQQDKNDPINIDDKFLETKCHPFKKEESTFQETKPKQKGKFTEFCRNAFCKFFCCISDSQKCESGNNSENNSELEFDKYNQNVIEDFEFREIGKGSFGTVYLALCKTSNERVAIKTIDKKRFRLQVRS